MALRTGLTTGVPLSKETVDDTDDRTRNAPVIVTARACVPDECCVPRGSSGVASLPRAAGTGSNPRTAASRAGPLLHQTAVLQSVKTLVGLLTNWALGGQPEVKCRVDALAIDGEAPHFDRVTGVSNAWRA